MFSFRKLKGKHTRYCNGCGANAHVQMQTAVMPEEGTDDDKLVTACLDFCRRCSARIGAGLMRASIAPKTKKRRR